MRARQEIERQSGERRPETDSEVEINPSRNGWPRSIGAFATSYTTRGLPLFPWRSISREFPILPPGRDQARRLHHVCDPMQSTEPITTHTRSEMEPLEPLLFLAARCVSWGVTRVVLNNHDGPPSCFTPSWRRTTRFPAAIAGSPLLRGKGFRRGQLAEMTGSGPGRRNPELLAPPT